MVLPDEPSLSDERHWNVTVEEERVDVRIESENEIILLENKINSGAKQQGQLLRYYLQEMDRTPSKRIIAVFLAPRNIGKDEVESVSNAPEFISRANDLVVHVSWEDLASYSSDSSDPFETLLRDGLDEIIRVIKEARLVKYAREGSREIIRNIVDCAYNELNKSKNIKLRRWSGKDVEEIITSGTNVTIWLDAVFNSSDEPPFEPISLVDENGLIQIDVRSQFKLARHVRKSSDLWNWWAAKVIESSFRVPEIGIYQLRENGWFFHSRHIEGMKNHIVNNIVFTGKAVVNSLSRYLNSLGFCLNRDESAIHRADVYSVVSLSKEGSEFYGCVEDKNEYRIFHTDGMQIIFDNTYPKNEYEDYEHFVGIMSKFDPYTFFMKQPIRVFKIDRETLERTWEMIKR